MPAFAHIASEDSICGIAWQQRTIVSGLNEIRHRVLVHDSTAGTGLRVTHATAAINDVNLSGGGYYYHPSIDQFQDFWQEQQNVSTMCGPKRGVMQ